ncbi:F-box domain-containing protein [Mycena kentingensis (nom. inval.)]|nr:F-box domain-containing protein [Mycena kentingensis (nom. inval.)]
MTICTRCGFGSPKTFTDNERHLLRSRISELTILIDALTEERRSLQAQSDTITYPILSIPPELTMEIFKAVCSPRDAAGPSLLRTSAPLLLTEVCRSWRQIAISTPELWQGAHLRARHPTEFVQMWIARTGRTPLDCYLYSDDADGLDALMECALQESRRWRVITLWIPLVSFPKLDHDLAGTSLPMLRSLTLEISNFSAPGMSVDEIEPLTIRNAPLLQELHLKMSTRLPVEVPWEQLTKLELGFTLSPANALGMVARCSQLIELKLDTISTDPDGLIPPVSPLLHSTLQKLDCNIGVGNDCILQHLTLSALTSLSSHRPLTLHPHHRLLIPLRNCEPETALMCLRELPASVTAITLAWHPRSSSGADFSLLTMPDILPRVERLSLSGGRMSPKHYADLMGVLRVRRPQLKELVLAVHMYSGLHSPAWMPSQEIVDEMREMARTGLKIRFTMSGRTFSTSHVILDNYL